MDLSVSPDLEAYLSYAIVVVLGATTATVQVSRRLGDIDGIWLISRTWLLFAAYLLVPVGLFWLLDRTSAITDTSFFAAVLVGVGYDRILSGSSQALRAPGELSQFWNPFLAYADKVSKMALQQSAKHQMRLVERVLASIAQDGPRYEAMQSLAIRFSRDAEGHGAAYGIASPARPAGGTG